MLFMFSNFCSILVGLRNFSYRIWNSSLIKEFVRWPVNNSEGSWVSPIRVFGDRAGWLASRKLAFFLWTAAFGSILAQDNVLKRVKFKWISFMNKIDWKLPDQLLLHWKFVRKLWGMTFALYGSEWMMRSSLAKFLLAREY